METKQPTYDELLTEYELLKIKNAQLQQKLSKKHIVQNENFEQLHSILDSIDAYIYVSDLETNKLLFANNYVNETFGDVVGQICWKAFKRSESSECHFCPNDRLIDDEGKLTGTYVWESFNPYTKCWYEVHSKAVKWKDNRVVKLEVAYDITNRKKDEKRVFRLLNQQIILSKISNKFNASHSLTQKILDVLSLVGKQTESSRAYMLLYRKNKKLCNIEHQWLNNGIKEIKKSHNFFDFFDDEHIKEQLNARGRVKINDVNYDIKSKHLVPYFSENSVLSLLVVPIYINKTISGYYCIEDCVNERTWHIFEISLLRTISDITSNVFERDRAEEKIRISEQKLREANAAKDKFFSIIAHDLKNPVNNLINLSEFLMENFDVWEREKTAEFIKYIYESSKQGFNLLENLLEWANSQTGKIKNKPANIKLAKLANDTISLLKTNAINKKIDLSHTIDESIEVYADANMISTVLRNLVSNALKFTPLKGKVSIKADYQLIDNQEKVIVKVKDTGIGISKDDLSNLFRIDVNHSTIGTQEERGTGLGLILCKEFIEQNKGKIWVDSQLEKGSTFIFTLPKAKNN